MSRLMSVAYTEQAVVERRKTVTRRKGWLFLKPGDRLTLCRKVMGRKPGEPLVRLAEVEVTHVDRQRLANLVPVPDLWPPGLIRTVQRYAAEEMVREGFPGMNPSAFVRRYFTEAQGIDRTDDVTRIEWRYLDTVTHYPEWNVWSAECDHGHSIWCIERKTEHHARRSLDAHLRAEHDIDRRAVTP